MPPGESKMWTPEQSPYPGIQGLRSSGFSPLITPCSLCPATESPECPLCLIAPPRPPVPGRPLFNLEDSPWNCCLVRAAPLGPSGENQNLSLLPSLGLPEPSVIPLFIACSSQVPLDTLLGGREGPQAGRTGSVTCLGNSWDFPGQLLWLITPSFLCVPGQRSPPTCGSPPCISPWLGHVSWSPGCAHFHRNPEPSPGSAPASRVTVSMPGRGPRTLRPALGEAPARKRLAGWRAGAGCPSGEPRRLSSLHPASLLLPWQVQTTLQRAGKREKDPHSGSLSLPSLPPPSSS